MSYHGMNFIKTLSDAMQELLSISAGWIGGEVDSNVVIANKIANTKPITHNGGKPSN